MPAGAETAALTAKVPRRAAGKFGDVTRHAWPAELAEQTKLVRGLLGAVSGAVTAREQAAFFDRAKPARLGGILDTLVVLGHARKSGEGYAAV